MMLCYFSDGPVPENRITRSQLQGLTGHSIETLKIVDMCLSEEHYQPHYYFGNLAVPSYHVRRDEWYCPHCFAEQNFIEAKWQLVWMPVCLKHQCELEKYQPNETQQLLCASNDDFYHEGIFIVQEELERRFYDEKNRETPIPYEASVVYVIDKYLKLSMGEKAFNGLDDRRRKYSRKFSSLSEEQVWLFMDCLYTQLVA